MMMRVQPENGEASSSAASVLVVRARMRTRPGLCANACVSSVLPFSFHRHGKLNHVPHRSHQLQLDVGASKCLHEEMHAEKLD